MTLTVDGFKLGHRHDIMEFHAEAVSSQVQQNKSNSTRTEDTNGPERDLRSCVQRYLDQAYHSPGGASSTRSRSDEHSIQQFSSAA